RARADRGRRADRRPGRVSRAAGGARLPQRGGGCRPAPRRSPARDDDQPAHARAAPGLAGATSPARVAGRTGRTAAELPRVLPETAALGGGWDPVALTRLLLATFPQDRLRPAVDALGARVEIDERAVRARLPLTWEMAAEMCRAGITIGSHTRTHPALPLESEEKVLDEVAGSRRALEHRLGVPVRHFAYPGGGFNRDTV